MIPAKNIGASDTEPGCEHLCLEVEAEQPLEREEVVDDHHSEEAARRPSAGVDAIVDTTRLAIRIMMRMAPITMVLVSQVDPKTARSR